MSNKRGNERSDPKPKLSDPYLLSKAYPEPTICPSCGLVFHKKRWLRDEHILSEVNAVAQKHKCPACRKIDDHYFMGQVFISGDFFIMVKNEIVNLIHNQEKKESFRNPLARIMSLKYQENNLVVETTTDNLAVMIGKAIKRSYNGDLSVSFSDGKIARVYWSRNQETGKSKKK
jgi:NMD protein affecting ribosome stability and mRNA decay